MPRPGSRRALCGSNEVIRPSSPLRYMPELSRDLPIRSLVLEFDSCCFLAQRPLHIIVDRTTFGSEKKTIARSTTRWSRTWKRTTSYRYDKIGLCL